MNAFKRSGCLVALTATLAVVALVSGCSAPPPTPVYTEVPGVSPSPGSPETQATAATAHVQPPPAEPGQPAASPENSELIVTPDETLTGTVVSVNNVGRFVVLRFPLGRMPADGAPLSVYRQGLKVAELKITGPQKDDHTVADIVTGECRPQDEVRNR